MKRKVCRISIKPMSCRQMNKQLQTERSKSVPKPFKVIRRAKQDLIGHQGQENSISTKKDKENNQLDLSDCIHDSFHINSITNSTICFDRTHRIQPINSNEFTLDIFEKNRKKKKKKRTGISSKICVSILVLTLLIGGFIGLIIYFLNKSTNIQTTTVSSIITTTQNSACSPSGPICQTPMFVWDRLNNCTKPGASYIYHSCCYQATSTQLTIEFLLREDVSNWFIDDVSITQGNGELLINGGFESNLTGWTAISSAGNLLVTPLTISSMSSAHSGSSYLYSEARMTFDRIKQTVNVIQGQNVNISFWWLDEGGVPGPTEVCEATVTLTP